MKTTSTPSGPRRLRPILALLALTGTATVLLSHCSLLRTITDFRKPKLHLRRVNVRDVSFRQLTLDFELELENPNPVGFSLATLDYRFDVHGKTLAQGSQPKGLKVGARAKSPLVLPFTVTYTELVDSVVALLESKDKVPYRIDLGFGLNTPIGTMTLPLTHSGDVPLPRLPALALEKAQISNLSFTGLKLSLALELTNRASFPLPAPRLGYTLLVADSAVAEGQSVVASSSVAPKKGASVTLPITLSFVQLGAAVVRAARERQLPFVLRTEIDFGPLSKRYELAGVAR